MERFREYHYLDHANPRGMEVEGPARQERLVTALPAIDYTNTTAHISRSGPLHSHRRLLHRSNRLLRPCQRARALDPLHRHLLELPPPSPPLHDPVMRRSRHLLPPGHLPPTPQTYSRADLPPPVAQARSRQRKGLEQSRQHPKPHSQ